MTTNNFQFPSEQLQERDYIICREYPSGDRPNIFRVKRRYLLGILPFGLQLEVILKTIGYPYPGTKISIREFDRQVFERDREPERFEVKVIRDNKKFEPDSFLPEGVKKELLNKK